MFPAISCCLVLGLLRGAAGVRAQSELSSARFTSSGLRLKDAITSAKKTLAAIRITQAGEDDADDGEDGDSESEDAEQASDLASYLFNATLQKCTELEVEPGRIDLKSKLREVCAQAEAQGLVAKLSERMNDAVVAEWLCGASSKEIEGCKETAESLLGGLQEVLEARLSAESLMKFSLYTVKAVATLAPLPPPLGVVLNKAADLVLNRLSREAEAELEDLESKMEQVSHRVVTEELLRLGAAQARAAEDQIQEMSAMDALWSDAISASAGGNDFARTMSQASSFNRWAAIEQGLATSAELLLPPSGTLDVEERARFARILKPHLEMHLLVLSHMHRAIRGTKHEIRLRDTLKKKARRAARSILPDLILLSATHRGADALTKAALNTPLLHRSKERPASCGDLEVKSTMEFEFLVVCIWFPLLSKPSAFAGALMAPKYFNAERTSRSDFIALNLNGENTVDPTEAARRMEFHGHQLECNQSERMEVVQRMYQEAYTYHRAAQRIFGYCAASTNRHHITFKTPGLCVDVVKFFDTKTIAELVAVELSEPSTSMKKLDIFGKDIVSSTCRLANRVVSRPQH
ncbi:unnamed protein product [Symbiodinium sp. CCMP2592]|nr:unnamed protein product [Symbiodinium sp. CCMP2592]